MLPLVGMVFRWTLLPFLLVLAQALAGGLLHALRGNGMEPSWLLRPMALWFAGGIAFRSAFAALLRRLGRDDPLEFIDTLEHELTHALVGYLTFCPPVSLSASLKSGGEVELKGTNVLAVLAPYFLPLWSLLVMLLGLVVKPGMQPAWNHLLFFLLGCFLYRLFREFSWRQTDLHVYGFLFSTIAVSIFLLLSLALILHLRGLLSARWVWESVRHGWHSIPAAWDWLRHRTGGPAPLETVPAR
jgi:hypothetical protein